MTPDSHASRDALERYVTGALAGAEARELEHHAAACELCAAALEREAKLEGALDEVAVRLGAGDTRPPPGLFARAWPFAASLAVAALVLLALPARRRAGIEVPAQARVAEASGDLLGSRVGDIDLEGLDVPMGQTGQVISAEPMVPSGRRAQETRE